MHHGGTVDPTMGSSEMPQIRSKTKEDKEASEFWGEEAKMSEPHAPPVGGGHRCPSVQGTCVFVQRTSRAHWQDYGLLSVLIVPHVNWVAAGSTFCPMHIALPGSFPVSESWLSTLLVLH